MLFLEDLEFFLFFFQVLLDFLEFRLHVVEFLYVVLDDFYGSVSDLVLFRKYLGESEVEGREAGDHVENTSKIQA